MIKNYSETMFILSYWQMDNIPVHEYGHRDKKRILQLLTSVFSSFLSIFDA
jgi:hypothetical protein